MSEPTNNLKSWRVDQRTRDGELIQTHVAAESIYFDERGFLTFSIGQEIVACFPEFFTCIKTVINQS